MLKEYVGHKMFSLFLADRQNVMHQVPIQIRLRLPFQCQPTKDWRYSSNVSVKIISAKAALAAFRTSNDSESWRN
jgi:hypothetical protein